MNGAVDVGFGGKMDDDLDGVLREDAVYQLPIADVSLDEQVSPRVKYATEIVRVGRVREGVQIDDEDAGIGALEVMDEVRADEARPSCDQDGPHVPQGLPPMGFDALIIDFGLFQT
jgi:hypothetical protein